MQIYTYAREGCSQSTPQIKKNNLYFLLVRGLDEMLFLKPKIFCFIYFTANSKINDSLILRSISK